MAKPAGASDSAAAPKCVGKTKSREVALEFESPIFNEEAILGLLDEWLVPMILDRVMKEIGLTDRLHAGDYYAHNNEERYMEHGQVEEGRAPTEARPIEAHPAASVVADGGGVQGVEAVCGGAADDDE